MTNPTVSERLALMQEAAHNERPGAKYQRHQQAVGLLPEQVAVLRQPFAAVKFMPQGGVMDFGGRKTCRFLAHIDSSLVGERLSEVDQSWTASYERLGDTFEGWKGSGFATVCYLTVCGVTREEIGYGGRTEPMKAAYSDALKRAALRFGVGAYLRDSGWEFWLDQKVKDLAGKEHEAYKVKKNDRGGEGVSILKPAGRASLQATYERILAKPSFSEHYGEARRYGDVDGELDESAPDGADDAMATEQGMTGEQVETLLMLQAATGRKTTEATLRARYEGTGMRFDRELVKVLAALQSTKNVSGATLADIRQCATDGAIAGLAAALSSIIEDVEA